MHKYFIAPVFIHTSLHLHRIGQACSEFCLESCSRQMAQMTQFGISSSAYSSQIISVWKYPGIEFCARTYTVGCGSVEANVLPVCLGVY